MYWNAPPTPPFLGSRTAPPPEVACPPVGPLLALPVSSLHSFRFLAANLALDDVCVARRSAPGSQEKEGV